MGHVVVHTDASGAWHLEDVTSIDHALERVETLRNVEGLEDVRLFEEIPLEVRTYYRVAVADGGPAVTPETGPGTSAGAQAPPAPRVPAATRDVAEDSSPELASWLSVTDAGGDEVASAPEPRTVDVADPPPGTFPLAGPPVPAAPAPAEDEEHADEPAPVGGRRGPRFSRDR